jgi:hypothetical protein
MLLLSLGDRNVKVSASPAVRFRQKRYDMPHLAVRNYGCSEEPARSRCCNLVLLALQPLTRPWPLVI